MRSFPAISLLLLLLLTLTAACAGPRSSGAYHTVLKGQTLYTISRVYDVDERYLARINSISDPTQLQVGARIFIPGAKQAVSVPVTVRPDIVDKTPVKPAPSPVTKSPPSIKPQPTPVKPPTTVTPQPPVVKPAPQPKTQATPLSKGRLIWPVRGKLLKKFDSKNGGSKGLEIAVAANTSVSSAAAGKVIYSGDGITGYGNLIIIRHDDSLFTVYGYNRKNLVDVGAFVSKGEKIALAGAPPSGGASRLYFEIRQGKKPVDPLFYLP